jgi:hypothetical protein
MKYSCCPVVRLPEPVLTGFREVVRKGAMMRFGQNTDQMFGCNQKCPQRYASQ